MSHKNSKQEWDNLSNKEKENLWLKTNGSRMVPSSLTGADLDKLFKQTSYEKQDQNITIGGQNSTGGGIPD